MATATEIATKALKRIRVISSGEIPAASDLSDAKDALADMIASWEADGLSGDTLPLPNRFTQAIIAMLGVRLCPDYGKQPDAVLARDASDGWKALQGAFFSVPRSSFERALKYTGHNTSMGALIGSSLDALSLWEASKDYALRTMVSNNFNIYECATAGTSASSGGPSGTGDSIADGSVVWVWRRVDGARDPLITIS